MQTSVAHGRYRGRPILTRHRRLTVMDVQELRRSDLGVAQDRGKSEETHRKNTFRLCVRSLQKYLFLVTEDDMKDKIRRPPAEPAPRSSPGTRFSARGRSPSRGRHSRGSPTWWQTCRADADALTTILKFGGRTDEVKFDTVFVIDRALGDRDAWAEVPEWRPHGPGQGPPGGAGEAHSRLSIRSAIGLRLTRNVTRESAAQVLAEEVRHGFPAAAEVSKSARATITAHSASTMATGNQSARSRGLGVSALSATPTNE